MPHRANGGGALELRVRRTAGAHRLPRAPVVRLADRDGYRRRGAGEFRSRTGRVPPAPRTDESLLRALPRRELGQAASLGNHQPGASQRLPGLSHGVANDGFARAPAARLPVGDTRRDAALRFAGIARPRTLSRLARAGAADG